MWDEAWWVSNGQAFGPARTKPKTGRPEPEAHISGDHRQKRTDAVLLAPESEEAPLPALDMSMTGSLALRDRNAIRGFEIAWRHS
jgi:hypothetical protein